MVHNHSGIILASEPGMRNVWSNFLFPKVKAAYLSIYKPAGLIPALMPEITNSPEEALRSKGSSIFIEDCEFFRKYGLPRDESERQVYCNSDAHRRTNL